MHALVRNAARTMVCWATVAACHRLISFYTYNWCHRDILRVLILGPTPMCRNLEFAKKWLERLPEISTVPIWVSSLDFRRWFNDQ